MAHTKIWSWCILLIGIAMTLAGFALAVIVPFLFPFVQEFFYSSFSSRSMIESLDSQNINHINWIYGVLGGVMLGWGTMISMLAYQNIRKAENWILNAILISMVSWYVLDTAISIYHSVIPNIVLNTSILVLVSVPIFIEKGRQRRA